MIAIKDMKMPSCCAKCDFKEDYCFYCNKLQKHISQSNFFNSRLPDCPLVEIGTCKDCEHRGAIYANGECYCDNDGTLRECNFYCKDFKKRGDENE